MEKRRVVERRLSNRNRCLHFHCSRQNAAVVVGDSRWRGSRSDELPLFRSVAEIVGVIALGLPRPPAE